VADFYLDLDTTAGGIQNTRNVNVGSSFNVEVSVDTAGLPWEGYQITLDYDDVELDGKLPGVDTGWTMVPVNGTNGGNKFVFTSGATCTPATQGASRNGEDDLGLANWAMTCTETTSGTPHTGDGALIQFTFTCEVAGPAAFDLRNVADTFLLDGNFDSWNDNVNNADVTCIPPPTNTPVPPTNTPAPNTATPTRTNTPTATNTVPPTATPAFNAAQMNKVPLGGDCDVSPSGLPVCNLWLCDDTDGAGPICSGPGEGDLTWTEVGVTPIAPLGAFEFQIKFDHKIFDINLECTTTQSPGPSCTGDADDSGAPGNGDDILNTDADTWDIQLHADRLDGTDGRDWGMNQCFRNVTENYINFACTSLGQPGVGDIGTVNLANVTVHPDDDLKFRMSPGNDNGIVRVILDENCEIADPVGHPVPGSIAGGLTATCGDIAITVRILEGDLDLDCDVDLADAQAIAQLYGMVFGLFLYDPWFDLEPNIKDFDIDAKDLQKVFGRIGSTCQNPIPAQPPVVPPQA
jgi:hypothetical protein